MVSVDGTMPFVPQGRAHPPRLALLTLETHQSTDVCPNNLSGTATRRGEHRTTSLVKPLWVRRGEIARAPEAASGANRQVSGVDRIFGARRRSHDPQHGRQSLRQKERTRTCLLQITEDTYHKHFGRDSAIRVRDYICLRSVEQGNSSENSRQSERTGQGTIMQTLRLLAVILGCVAVVQAAERGELSREVQERIMKKNGMSAELFAKFLPYIHPRVEGPVAEGISLDVPEGPGKSEARHNGDC